MTSSNPPYPYFNGIKYNSLFFPSNSTGLSQSQANALYLQKTVPDTASAIETFSNGILTNSLDTTVVGTLNIGNNNANSISIGRTGSAYTTMYGGITYLVSGYLETLLASTTLNLGSLTTSVINIGINSLRTGAINIGTGANTAAGSNVNINNGAASGANVNILSGTGSTGQINLGSLTSITKCNSGLTFGNNKFITMGNNSALPVLGQVGYNTLLLSGGTLTTSTTVTTSVSLGTIPIGVYMVTLSCGNGSSSVVSLSLSSTTGFTYLNTGTLTPLGYANLNAIVGLTTATTYYLVAGSTTVVSSIGNINVAILRIA